MPVFGGQNAEMGLFCARKRANFAGLPAAFLERKNTHAGGVSVLPLSERRGGTAKFARFRGSKCRNGAVLRPKTGKFCGAPRRVFRAEKHSRRRRECFAALGRSKNVAGGTAKFARFRGSKCRNGAVLRPKTGQFCGAPRRVFRAEKHSRRRFPAGLLPRRRRGAIAAICRRRRPVPNNPDFRGNQPDSTVSDPEKSGSQVCGRRPCFRQGCSRAGGAVRLPRFAVGAGLFQTTPIFA